MSSAGCEIRQILHAVFHQYNQKTSLCICCACIDLVHFHENVIVYKIFIDISPILW